MVLPFLIGTGFRTEDIHILPISGILGENVMTKATEPKLTSWFGTD
jgi:translation elongation factor EF-1alpha